MKKKIKKIVILLTRKHFENRDYITFGCNELIRGGYELEVWTAVNWLYNNTIETPKRCYIGKELSEINSEKQWIEKLNQLDIKHTFFLIYPGEMSEKPDILIRRTIKLRGGKYGDYYFPQAVDDGCIHLKPERFHNWLEVTKHYYRELSRVRLDIVINSILFPSTYNFLQGEGGYSRLNNKYDSYKKKTIVLHSMDYDYYLEANKEKNKVCEGRFIVYIDQALGHHPNFKKKGFQCPIKDVDKFYKELNEFFELVEKTYDCEVVIACHPKAEYSKNPFNGRKMFEYKTERLIKDSVLCIWHFSTALSFILLFKKDFFQIVNAELIKDRAIQIGLGESKKYLQSKVLNLSNLEEESIKDYLNVYKTGKYTNYLKQFVYSPQKRKVKNICVIEKLIRQL